MCLKGAEGPGGQERSPLGAKRLHCSAHQHRCERSQEQSFTSQTLRLFLAQMTSLLVLCHADNESSTSQRASWLLQLACWQLAPWWQSPDLPSGLSQLGFSFFLLRGKKKKAKPKAHKPRSQQSRVNSLLLRVREMWHHVQAQRMWAGAISLPHAALEMELSPALQLPGCSWPGLPLSPGSC